MVANIGGIGSSNGKFRFKLILTRLIKGKPTQMKIFVVFFAVEATAYLGAVAGFAALLLVVLLFLNRRWCYSAVFGRKCCDDILAVNVRAPDNVDHAHFGKFVKCT